MFGEYKCKVDRANINFSGEGFCEGLMPNERLAKIPNSFGAPSDRSVSFTHSAQSSNQPEYNESDAQMINSFPRHSDDTETDQEVKWWVAVSH